MAETDEKPDAKYVGLWEVHLKAVNSLLIAHGAGLVACLTLLKDYDTTPHLKHIGWFIGLFAFGLLWGMLAHFSLILHREHVACRSRVGLKGENGVAHDGRLSGPLCS
jgi:hypothetical protein